MFKTTRLCKGLMLAFGGSVVIAALPSLAQAQRVEITGSSIKRVEAEGALQVQTLTRTDIDRAGVQTTEQLLQTISAMSSSGQTQTAGVVGISTYGSSGVSLRGLGEERTLVLVNGQRLAAFAGGGGSSVNVNNIPLAAIERVEILKDGASAVYGSDAVAGVVNFILTKNFQGYQIGGTYGTPTSSGGGQQYQANIIAGWGDQTKDGWNLTMTGQWTKNQDLLGADRSFSKTANRPPYFQSGGTGQGNIQGAWELGTGPKDVGDLVYQGGGSGYGNPLASPVNQCSSINMALAPTPSAAGLPYCNFDYGPFVGLLAQTENTSITANFNFNLNAKAQLYADAIWSKTTVTSAYQPSPLRTSFMATDEEFAKQGVDPVLLLRKTNPAYKTAADYLNANGLGALANEDLGITARVFDFGRRTSQDESTQTRLTAGIRGEWLEQSYDVTLGFNQNKLQGKVTDGYFSQVGFARATQAPGSDWNPWTLTQSQAFQSAVAAAKYVGPTLNSTAQTVNVQGVMSGDVMKMPAGSMQYAAGYQYRSESLNKDPAPALFTGDIAGLGGATKPIDASRTVNAVFGELNVPVVKDLDLNLAARSDWYSDFGNTINWKGNVRWQPTQQLLMRGSYGTGFRAPTLTDLYDPQVLGTSSEIDDPVTGQKAIQVNELSGGNPNLNPETSKQWSLGMVFQPTQTIALGIDYFSISVDNVVAQPGTQEIVDQAAAGNPSYTGLVTRNPPGTGSIVETRTVLGNFGNMTVQGWDFDARYREKLGPGVLALQLNSTYTTKFAQTTPDGSTQQKVGTTVISGTCTPVVASTAGLDGYGVVLRYKQYFTANWTQGDWSTTLGNSYASPYGAGCDLNDSPTRMPALSLWDLQVAYSGFKNTVLTLGARNILDTQPAVFVSNSNAFQAGYDPSQYDPRGRFVYLTGTFKF
jgi:iron complex outermembrane receptor protein